MACVRAEVEDRREIEPRADLLVGLNELAEIELFVPGAHRVALHQAVRVVAREPGLDEGEQHTLAEEEVLARLEVAAHPLLAYDETFDEPDEAVEHVVE